jgi:ubiquinone/menaquinone biosynthesis C-methylase UbiE
MDPYDVVTPDYKLKLRRDLEELQTDLAKASSANAYCWIKKGNITKALTKGSTKILDVGCGWGRELARLKNAIGIDICLPFLRAARNYTNNDVILASATSLPFKEDAFDCLVMSEVIEHLKEQETAMREAVRVLKDQGRIVLQTPNSHWTRQKIVAERYGHVHEFNPEELFRFLTYFGFRDLQQFGSTIPYIPSGNRFSACNENIVFFTMWKFLDRLCPLKWDIIISSRLMKTRSAIKTG